MKKLAYRLNGSAHDYMMGMCHPDLNQNEVCEILWLSQIEQYYKSFEIIYVYENNDTDVLEATFEFTTDDILSLHNALEKLNENYKPNIKHKVQ